MYVAFVYNIATSVIGTLCDDTTRNVTGYSSSNLIPAGALCGAATKGGEGVGKDELFGQLMGDLMNRFSSEGGIQKLHGSSHSASFFTQREPRSLFS